MKKLLIILLILLIPLSFVGCSPSTETESHADIIINMPTDNTVNGYRTESVVKDEKDTIPTDKVGVESQNPISESKAPDTAEPIQYCANINSKTFHKTDCGSAKNLKEENKYITSNRDELIQDGYTPCKKCNP
ncbi:MAG: hypothetical protein J6D52_06745 [Clostridia bacterium]|nr:hypothetical protein [Clostridia bacterium]